MGYTTQFEGVIKANRELLGSEIAFIKNVLESEYPENRSDFIYIDLHFNNDFTGFGWDGSEKSYNMEKQVNFAIKKIVEQYPDLMFNGEMKAQGEEFDDRWFLRVRDNKVSRADIKIKGKKVTCPHCEEEFTVDGQEIVEGEVTLG